MVETSLDYLRENKDAFTEYQLAKKATELVEAGYLKKDIYEALGMGHSKFYSLLSRYNKNELSENDERIKYTERELQDKIKELVALNCSRNAICLELHIGRRRLNRLLDSLGLSDYRVVTDNKTIIECNKEKHNVLPDVVNILDKAKDDNIQLEEQVLGYYDKVISVWKVCEELNISIEQFNKIVLSIERKNRENGVKFKLNVKDNSEDFTLVEKINYANATYGYKCWSFISKEELKSLITCDKI